MGRPIYNDAALISQRPVKFSFIMGSTDPSLSRNGKVALLDMIRNIASHFYVFSDDPDIPAIHAQRVWIDLEFQLRHLVTQAHDPVAGVSGGGAAAAEAGAGH